MGGRLCAILEKSNLGGGNGKCKGPEAGMGCSIWIPVTATTSRDHEFQRPWLQAVVMREVNQASV